MSIRFKFPSRGRPVFQAFLSVVFFTYFGWPAVERYLERKVMVVRNERYSEGTPAPSISLQVGNPYTAHCFKANKEIQQGELFTCQLTD